MTTPTDASARITRIEKPIVSPGCCAICGKSEHPLGFAATDNFDFDFYGTVYFCADCVGDYARIFGYLSPEDFVKLREHIDAQNAELNMLRQSVTGLESTVDSLTTELTRRGSVLVNPVDSTVSADSLVSGPMVQSDAEPASPDIAESTQAPTDAEPNVTEHADESGRNDVYDTTAADELLGL